jgi:hypothetical protein
MSDSEISQAPRWVAGLWADSISRLSTGQGDQLTVRLTQFGAALTAILAATGERHSSTHVHTAGLWADSIVAASRPAPADPISARVSQYRAALQALETAQATAATSTPTPVGEPPQVTRPQRPIRERRDRRPPDRPNRDGSRSQDN